MEGKATVSAPTWQGGASPDQSLFSLEVVEGVGFWLGQSGWWKRGAEPQNEVNREGPARHRQEGRSFATGREDSAARGTSFSLFGTTKRVLERRGLAVSMAVRNSASVACGEMESVVAGRRAEWFLINTTNSLLLSPPGGGVGEGEEEEEGVEEG